MKHFRYSANSVYEADEAGFLVTSLEAAVEHVKSGSLKIGSSHMEGEVATNGVTNGEKEEEKATNGTDEPDGAEVSISALFEHAKKGNLSEVQRILSEKVESNGLSKGN